MCCGKACLAEMGLPISLSIRAILQEFQQDFHNDNFSSTLLSGRGDNKTNYGSDLDSIIGIQPRYFCAIPLRFICVF